MLVSVCGLDLGGREAVGDFVRCPVSGTAASFNGLLCGNRDFKCVDFQLSEEGKNFA